jgi:hypothetical protein
LDLGPQVIQVMLFKELVKVRYNKYVADLSRVEKRVPLFRTLQVNSSTHPTIRLPIHFNHNSRGQR